jgi:hypothetical protein
MTNANVMRVKKAEMLRLLHAEPDFAEVFTAHLLTRNSRVEADLADHLFNSSEKRLAAPFCCWRISAKREGQSPSSRKSVRRRSRR